MSPVFKICFIYVWNTFWNTFWDTNGYRRSRLPPELASVGINEQHIIKIQDTAMFFKKKMVRKYWFLIDSEPFEHAVPCGGLESTDVLGEKVISAVRYSGNRADPGSRHARNLTISPALPQIRSARTTFCARSDPRRYCCTILAGNLARTDPGGSGGLESTDVLAEKLYRLSGTPGTGLTREADTLGT